MVHVINVYTHIITDFWIFKRTYYSC